MTAPELRQDGYAVRFGRGGEGIDALADRAVLVVVDALSFTTSADRGGGPE